MKVLIAVDFEDIHGIAYLLEYEHFEFGRKMCTLDTNAATNILNQTTVGATGSNAWGQPVRPEFAAATGQRWTIQKANLISRLVAHNVRMVCTFVIMTNYKET